MYKILFLLVTFNFLVFISMQSFATESVAEKVEASAKDTGRAIKKGANRVQEAVCTDGQIKCGAKKAGNRISETADAAVDGASEAKNKLDD